MQKTAIMRAGVVAALFLCALSARAACGPEQYFGPQDVSQQSPLARPHSDFDQTRRYAAQGVAAEERNLAALYDSGYLVSMCRDKAVYWYARAAQHGDDIAKEWIERYAAAERLRNGPECFGDACMTTVSDGVAKTVLKPGPGGSYATMVTINGRKVPAIIDTGASFVSMSAKTAQSLGIEYTNGRALSMKTANGSVSMHATILDTVSIGNLMLRQVEAVVGEADHPVLIGMSFLRRLTITTSGNTMTLAKP